MTDCSNYTASSFDNGDNETSLTLQAMPSSSSLSTTGTPLRETLLPDARGFSVNVHHTNNNINSKVRSTTTKTSSQLSNASSLQERLIGDVAIASLVTAGAAPFLTIVDKALVQRSVGSHTILQSAKSSFLGMCSNPIAYVKSPTFLWMWATYALTYSAANTLRTLTEHQDHIALESKSIASSETAPSQANNTTAILFVGTTVVNSSASMIKDRAYAKLFGNTSVNSTMAVSVVPKISYGLWAARDLTVIGSSFVLPSHVSKLLQESGNWSESQANKVAQIGTPIAAQLVAGPLHFCGLDCFNRPLSSSTLLSNAVNRLRHMSNAYVEVVAARMIRIIPGYGIAGVYNTQFRNEYRNYLIETKVRKMMTAQQEQRSHSLHQPTAAAVASSSVTVTAVPPASAAVMKTHHHRPTRSSEAGDLVALIRAKSKRYSETNNVAPPPSA